MTPNAPNINFSVPTIGSLVIPNAVALAPPAEPLKTPAPLRNVPTVIDTTGKGGDRPEPIYPPLAKQMGQQGRVVIAFTVDESGESDFRRSKGNLPAFPFWTATPWTS